MMSQRFYVKEDCEFSVAKRLILSKQKKKKAIELKNYKSLISTNYIL